MSANGALKGRTVLVTGATDGIGKATALGRARMGARVLLHGRDPEKGLRVQEEIARTTGGDPLNLFIADLASRSHVVSLPLRSWRCMNICTFSSTCWNLPGRAQADIKTAWRLPLQSII